MRFLLKNVRLAFADLFETSAVGDGVPAFGCRLILPPDHPQVSEIDEAYLKLANEQFKGKGEQIIKELMKDRKKSAWQKQDYLDKNMEPYSGFEGMYSLGTRVEDVQPKIIDRDKTPLKASDGRPYAGCYVNAQVDLWVQDNQYGRGLRAKPLVIQFVRDGDSFSGATAKVDEMPDLSADDDDMSDIA
jgi:hypothetical protein